MSHVPKCRESYRSYIRMTERMTEDSKNCEPESNSDDLVNNISEEELDEDSSRNHSVNNEAHIRNSQTAIEKSPLSINWLVIISVVIVCIFLGMWPIFFNSDKSIKYIKQRFPNQPNETFDDFETIIDDILFTKSIHPAVFLFLYETNEQKVNDIIHHLAEYATSRLKTTTFTEVQKNEFHTNEALNDYGYLVDKYKSDLIENKVMVVKNLQNIPAQTAQVFHSFCDEITPLVERVVYIFTLKVNSIKGKEEKIAETNLKMFWKELDNDILMPLITRVTSTVLKILS